MCTQSCLRVSASPQGRDNFTLDLCFDDSGQMYHHEVNNLFYTKVKGHGAHKPKVTLPPQHRALKDILFSLLCFFHLHFVLTLGRFVVTRQ